MAHLDEFPQITQKCLAKVCTTNGHLSPPTRATGASVPRACDAKSALHVAEAVNAARERRRPSTSPTGVTAERQPTTSPIEIRIEPLLATDDIIKLEATRRTRTPNGSGGLAESRARTPVEIVEIRARTPVDGAAESVISTERSITKVPLKVPVKRTTPHAPLQRSQTARTPAAISSIASAPTAAAATPKPAKPLDREREQGGDYLIEICGRYLNVYGSGAIKFIDRQWNAQKANDVHTVKFSYVSFGGVAAVFGRIKHRFANAEHIAFRETNIEHLGQLNALAELQGLTSLLIEPDGNPICQKEWRPYAIFRLAHWGIKTINGADITKDELDRAHQLYAGLSDLVLWSLPDTLIEPLLLRLHLEDSCTANGKVTAKQWLMQADASLRTVVGKEALQYKAPAPNAIATFNHVDEFRQRGRQCLSGLMDNTFDAVNKLEQVESLWPTMLLDMIKNVLIDYAQIDFYLDNLLGDLFKEV